MCRRVACPRLDGDVETHFLNRHCQIAMNIDSKCLERRNIKRVNTTLRHTRFFAATPLQINQCRQKTSQRFTCASGGDQQRGLPLFCTRKQLQLMGARRPALFRKPFHKTVWQMESCSLRSRGQVQRHFPNLMLATLSAKMFVHFCSHFVSSPVSTLFPGRSD